MEIVIIGGGLTGLVTAFYLHKGGKRVRILEKSERLGGNIQTFNESGFIFESGPNTGSVSHPEVTELFNDLSPNCEMETASENSKRRLIWKNGRFHALPSGLIGGITTPLFTFPDKFRILGEPFRSKGTDPSESVAQLTRRRLGKSFLDYAVDPFISGIYAGDPDALVTRYALPKLYNLEQNHGSFIKGSIAKAKQTKTERDRLATKKVFSACGGLGQLTSALTKAIGMDNITLSAERIKVRPFENRWQLTYNTPGGEETIYASKVISTVGAYALADMLPFAGKEKMAAIVNLRYAPIVQIAVGIKDTQGIRFNAFGGLIPSCEKRRALGILFPSACFRGRAPEHGALLSFFIGGMKSSLASLTDDELIGLVEEEFHAMLRFPPDKSPDMIRIFRHPYAIPQYEKNSGERFAAVEHLQNLYPGLTLAGNIRDGISMADRILQAATIAKNMQGG
ncbi:MAG: protoporphyrinogen oxidase [Clostridiales Family XIII bacterium]|jgi:oxygen-dependent protoporphyrinogen oxidase|nr:protoporphyrinogen oxidase [Clostridiales Family XIII bacterium]